MWPFELLFIPILNLLLEFEPNYFISSTKVPPKKNICTCNFQVGLNERYVGIVQKKKKKKKNPFRFWRSLYFNDNVECLGHEYLAILVGCQLFTAYWLSAFIWSRFVNETHEYLIIHLLTIGGKPKTWWISVGTCEATHWQPGLVT